MLSQEQFLERAKTAHGDRYDYSYAIYTRASDKLCIVCPDHGKFWQRASLHMKGNGCTDCGLARRDKVNTRSISERVAQFKHTHGDRYDYSRISSIKNAHEKVEIFCKACKKSFFMGPITHTKGHGCKTCSVKTRARKKTYSQSDFVSMATATHGDKYSYEKSIYVKGAIPVDVFCNSCESYFSILPVRLIHHKCGCPNCKKSRGFDQGKPGTLYYLAAKDKSNGTDIYKLGITNRSTETRFGSYLKDEIFHECHFNRGADAKQAEQKIFDMFSEFRIRNDHFGRGNGTTEWFSKDVLGMFQPQPYLFDIAVDMACNGHLS